MKKLLLLLFLIPSLALSEEKNPLIRYKPLGDGCIYTIDLTINENLKDRTIIAIGTSQVRTQGIITQIYYTAGMGNSVFSELPNSNIKLMNGAIGLPVSEWKGRGVRNGETVRIVVMEPDSCSEPIGLLD